MKLLVKRILTCRVNPPEDSEPQGNLCLRVGSQWLLEKFGQVFSYSCHGGDKNPTKSNLREKLFQLVI